MFRECSDSAHRLHSKKPLPLRVTGASVERHVERPWVRSKNVYIAEPAPGASTDVLREIGAPVPRDRRGVGRLPSRSALIWRTTRSRTGGAGAIETPTPGAVPDFIPVVGRYRATATWRLSFHSGMNAADTSAWQGASSLRVTSSRVRCGPLVLLPLQMRETLGAQPRRLIAATNQPMRVMLG